MDEWTLCEKELPEEGIDVLIYDGNIHIGHLVKGISLKDREEMRSGLKDDPIVYGWSLTDGYFETRRSNSFRHEDEHGNNLRPYCWKINNGLYLFGQNVTKWTNIPKL